MNCYFVGMSVRHFGFSVVCLSFAALSLTTAAPMIRAAPIHPAASIVSCKKKAEQNTDTTGSR